MEKTRNILISILSFVLLLTMALGVVGCNGDNNADQGGDETAQVVITLDKTSLNLDERSEAQQLTAAVYIDGVIVENPSLTWASLNDDVVTVSSNGLVTVVGIGETAVTCTYQENSTSCTVKVSKYYAPQFEVVATPATKEITSFVDGYTFKIDVTAHFVIGGGEANPEYTFASSNEAVATVDGEGTVTIIGQGECVITVTGSLDGGSAIDTVAITVSFGDTDGSLVPDQQWPVLGE